MPALETVEGEFLTESDAILLYMADDTPFLPGGRLDRTKVLQWMLFEQYSHEPNIAVARAWLHVFGPGMTEDRRLALETKQKVGYDALGVMEGRPRRNGFLVAGRFTVADIALLAYTHVAHDRRLPAVRSWATPRRLPAGARPHHARLTPTAARPRTCDSRGGHNGPVAEGFCG